tara:strand:+ start:150 stop:302 length:153 start_codon:yes stop_codon:yes gene_type:complete
LFSANYLSNRNVIANDGVTGIEKIQTFMALIKAGASNAIRYMEKKWENYL